MPLFLVWPQRDGQSYTLLDTSTADTLLLDQSFFRPLGMQHFCDSFAYITNLRPPQGCSDFIWHITRAGVLRIGLGAHQEHMPNITDFWFIE